MKILIVEDDPMVADTLADMVNMLGHDTVVFPDAVQALNSLNSDIQMIISDLGLPIMDGFGFLEKVRAHPVYGDLPFVVLTARSDRESMIRAKKLGADEYLLKPFSSKTVQKTIEEIEYRFWSGGSVDGSLKPADSGERPKLSCGTAFDEMIRRLMGDPTHHNPGLSL